MPCREEVHPNGWPHYCFEHAEDYKASYNRYKAASESAEAIRECILVWEDKGKIAELGTLVGVQDAIELTETYIQHASEELRGRELHTMIFFAHGTQSVAVNVAQIFADDDFASR